VDPVHIDFRGSALGEVLASVLSQPAWSGPGLGQESLLEAARQAAGPGAGLHELARKEFPELLSFATAASADGLAIVDGLPSAAGWPFCALVLGEILGRVVKYPNEGDYLIEVKENRDAKSPRPGFNNSKEFFAHTDLSYVESPPEFMCLHSVVNDERQGGWSGFCDLADVIGLLKDEHVAELLREGFLFPAPPHFRGGGCVQHAILNESDGYPGYTIRFRRDSLRCLSRGGVEAVSYLCEALQKVTREIFLAPQSIVIVKNRRVLHSRTAFLTDTATAPRQLNRVYFESITARELS
jgi:hypothetical protein